MALKDRFNVVLTGRNNQNINHAQQFTGKLMLSLGVKNIESKRNQFLLIACAGL